MDNKRSTGSILAIVGGIGLAISAFLTWGKVTLDAAKFASALGVDPNLVPVGSLPSQTVSGTDGWEGKAAIVAGVVAIVVAVIAMREVRKGLGVLLIVAGVLGAGVALYDVVTVNDQKDAAIEDAAPGLSALGVQTSQLSDAIDVSLQAGIWICIISGLVVVAGGVMVRSGEGSAATTEAGAGFAMGMSAPPAASGGSPTPPPAAPTMPPTQAVPPVDPSPPAEPPSSGPPGIEQGPSGDDGSIGAP
jgi:hypothetical protein